MKALIYILGLIVGVASCSSVDCSENGYVTCNYAVMDHDGMKDTIPGWFSVVITRAIDGNDSVLINMQQKTTSFSLPMSYSFRTDTLHLVMVTDTAQATWTDYYDKVYVTKTNDPYYEDTDCAPRYSHKILNISSTHNFIDTLLINNNSVSNEAINTNIHLLLRTDIDF